MRSELADQRLQPVRNLATNPSFETAGAVTTVRTNLCVNPNFEAGVAGWTAQSSTIVASTAQKRSGAQSLLATLTAADRAGTFTSFTQTVEAVYTLSAWVFAPVSITVRAAYTKGTVTSGGAATVIPAGVWTRISATGTATNATGYLSVITTVAPAADTLMYVDDVLLEASPALGADFNGSTAAAGDFTYAWSGTVNASTSLQQGLSVAGASNSANAHVQSTEWASTGTRSIRIIPTTSATTSVVYPAGTSGVTLGMAAGKTYTVIAKCRLAAALTGTLRNDSRSIVLVHDDDGITSTTASSAAPNAAGETVLRLTATLSASASKAFFYLSNGSSAGNGDVWWDDLMIVEGVYVGDYGDGNTPGWRWDGDSEASTSTGYPSLSRP